MCELYTCNHREDGSLMTFAKGWKKKLEQNHVKGGKKTLSFYLYDPRNKEDSELNLWTFILKVTVQIRTNTYFKKVKVGCAIKLSSLCLRNAACIMKCKNVTDLLI